MALETVGNQYAKAVYIALWQAKRPVTLGELARSQAVHRFARNTLRKYLEELAGKGFAERKQDGKYFLVPSSQNDAIIAELKSSPRWSPQQSQQLFQPLPPKPVMPASKNSKLAKCGCEKSALEKGEYKLSQLYAGYSGNSNNRNSQFTFQDLEKAFQYVLGCGPEEAFEASERLLDYFGNETQILDNFEDNEERGPFYILEEWEFVKPDKKEDAVILSSGASWSIYYWVLQVEKILELAEKQRKQEAKPAEESSDVYSDETLWQRARNES